MCVKISYVLLPRNDTNSNKLRNWDLWGPFLMVVIFALFVDSNYGLLLVIRFIVVNVAIFFYLYRCVYSYF
jgi:hypothetical protein